MHERAARRVRPAARPAAAACVQEYGAPEHDPRGCRFRGIHVVDSRGLAGGLVDGSSFTCNRLTQRVWGARYIDEPLYAQSDSTPSDDFGNALAWYALTDRLFSVIGLTDFAGAPVERVRSSAYGVGRHTDAGWAAQKGEEGPIDRAGAKDSFL